VVDLGVHRDVAALQAVDQDTSHSGRRRPSGRAVSREISLASYFSSAGAGSAISLTWYSMSNS
jgi:hypothetical protein